MLGEPLSLYPILVRDYFVAGPLKTIVTLAKALRDPVEEKLPLGPPPASVARGRGPYSPAVVGQTHGPSYCLQAWQWLSREAHTL